jgi:BMFP domain-containing protein YqiC
MTAYVTREEFEARVGVLEREVEGEKLVTRHVLQQTRHNGDDLAALKTRLERVEGKLDEVGQKLGAVEQRLGTIERKLPEIVATTMREVLDERDRRR